MIHGGCSDDSFTDFRASLISHGRTIFENALNDPETLADVDFGDVDHLFFEEFQYVMVQVAEEQLGEILERPIGFPNDPAGEEWDEDSVEQRYR